MSAEFDQICGAIRKRQQVTATYKGYHREMCPHVAGYKKGREKALLYQFGGESSSGLGPAGDAGNWRCVFVEDLTNVQVRDAAWHTASNHSRSQTCVDEIVAEVGF
jgi:hypothetical protein